MSRQVRDVPLPAVASQGMCFTCGIRPAGNSYAGPYSAYCAGCQPRDTRPEPHGRKCWCARCEVMFATPTDFDSHLRGWEHVHPAVIGLELAGGVWGTPAGNANRARKARQIKAARAAFASAPSKSEALSDPPEGDCLAPDPGTPLCPEMTTDAAAGEQA